MAAYKYKREQPTLKDPIRNCTVCGKEYKAVAPLQKTCSKECRKVVYDQNMKRFKDGHPGAHIKYGENRKNKNPNIWKERAQKHRLEIINALGGMCIVEGCGVTNPHWLHADYMPAMKGTGWRHPRYRRWVMDNIKCFRLLCANHHYELSISGKIEGTNITQ